ncbi:MAG: hypothetical protein QNJ90_05235 [Planctomycetota bacterium]|nr:hypothetical protein [Planctomycetota bacterium]
MSADPVRPPPFYCPACGKKHRADLRALQCQAGATARVTCARCEAVMSLRIGDDGLPTCEILQQPAKDGAAETAVATSPGGAMSKSNMPVSILVAAVVAAAVSFGVGRLTATGDAPTASAPDSRVAALEQQLAMLAGDLKDARAKAEAAQSLATTAHNEIRAVTGSVQTGLQANAAKVTAIEDAQGSLGKAFEEMQGKYKAFNGRIEGNYTELRSVKKRVKALEAR